MSLNPVARLQEAMIWGMLGLSVMALSGTNAVSSRGKTSTEALHEYGIDLSEPSLIAALTNANPRVRRLAASQLSSDRDLDAVPDIERALLNEKDPQTRVGIAAALPGLHDQLGVDTIQSMCSDTTLPIGVIISAVETLKVLRAPIGGCSESVLRSLAKPSDRDYLDTTLTLLPWLFPEVSSDEATLIVETLKRFVGDRTQQPSVRLAAGNALAEIGAPDSIDAVHRALSEEDNPDLRGSLQSNLDRLQSNQGKE